MPSRESTVLEWLIQLGADPAIAAERVERELTEARAEGDLKAERLRAALGRCNDIAANKYEEVERLIADLAAEKAKVARAEPIVTLARQWANCEPDSLPDRLARKRMRDLFGLDDA